MERKMNQIGDDKLGAIAAGAPHVLSRQLGHIAREVEANNPACGQTLHQQCG